MNLDLVITQLRTCCPAIRFVGGAADFSAGVETVVNPDQMPAAFVIPLAEEAGENLTLNGLIQTLIERIGLVCIISNTSDRRGQFAASQIETLKYGLFRALLNWSIDPTRAARGLQYAGGQLLEMDRARLFYQFDFELETTITDSDGFQPPGDDLTRVEIDVVLDQPAPATPEPDTVEVDVELVPPGGHRIWGTDAIAEAGNITVP